jgi:hypothetical protein
MPTAIGIADLATQIDALCDALIGDRQYDQIVTVSPGAGNIVTALAAISDAAWNKRYCLYLPDGTYAETSPIDLASKPWVDVIGQSRAGVIVTSSNTDSGQKDTFLLGGGNAMLRRMTVRHVSESGITQYPIHADANNHASLRWSKVVLDDVACESTGAIAKQGIGIGLKDFQRIYLLRSSFSSVLLDGAYIHNTAGEASGSLSCLAAIGCDFVSTGAGKYGIVFGHYANGKHNQAVFRASRFKGPTGSIRSYNAGGGATDGFLIVDPDCVLDGATSIVDSTKFLRTRWPIPRLPAPPKDPYDYPETLDISATGARLTTVSSNPAILPVATGNTIMRVKSSGSSSESLLLQYYNGTELAKFYGHMKLDAGLTRFSSGSLAVTGSTLSGAAVLAAQVTTLTGCDGTKGCKPPSPTTTLASANWLVVINATASDAKVYPDAAGTAIDALGAGNPYTLAAGTRKMFCWDGTQWWSF